MGGNVFKLPSDYIAEGIAEGKAEGIAEGKAEGILLERIAAVTKKVKRGQELPIIAEALEYDEDSIRPIYDAVKAAAPDYDSEQILRKILEEK